MREEGEGGHLDGRQQPGHLWSDVGAGGPLSQPEREAGRPGSSVVNVI